jgi:hypothetical protein
MPAQTEIPVSATVLGVSASGPDQMASPMLTQLVLDHRHYPVVRTINASGMDELEDKEDGWAPWQHDVSLGSL